jgi:hypothetical protein
VGIYQCNRDNRRVIIVFWLNSSRSRHLGTRWHSWLRHYTTSWKIAGWYPDEVDIFNLPNPSSRIMALCSTQPRRLRTLWASTACYRDRFFFYKWAWVIKRNPSVVYWGPNENFCKRANRWSKCNEKQEGSYRERLCVSKYFLLILSNVAALCYKLEGRRFESRMGWIFLNLLNPSSRIVALGSTQPLAEMSTRNLPVG